ncbi:MAG: hypothetical protein F4Y44_03330 [Chloroflexi bacterium]|nr:hypothetical protein [Chloroflexota bacterium]
MQSDPLTSKGMRALLIIAGVIIFGSPIYYILAWGLGISDATISVFILAALAIAAFLIIRRYFNRSSMHQPAAKPFRSTGVTRGWPQKYSKHRRKQYWTTANKRGKPRTSLGDSAVVRPLRFLRLLALWLITRSEMDKSLDNRLHRQTRWSDEIYPE